MRGTAHNFFAKLKDLYTILCVKLKQSIEWVLKHIFDDFIVHSVLLAVLYWKYME